VIIKFVPTFVILVELPDVITRTQSFESVIFISHIQRSAPVSGLFISR